MSKPNQGQGLLIRIIIGVILGGICGTLLPEFSLHLKILGEIFLNALKMMVLPLIVTSMIVGVAGIGDPSQLGSLGIRTFVYYMGTTMVAVLVGIGIVTFFNPGDGFVVIHAAELAVKETPAVSFMDTISRLIHPNLVRAAADFEILPLITFSILFGMALVALGKHAYVVTEFMKTLNDVIMQIVHWIILFTPLGVFGLIAYRLGQAGGGEAILELLVQLGKYCGTLLLGLLIHGAIVLPLILVLFTKRNPVVFFKQLSKALLIAFGTSSSSATLPVTMECVKEEAKVNDKVADVVLPIGATVNMDGTALYEAVAVIFIAQAYGVPLGLGELFIIFFTANLAAIGAAGIPEAGLVTMVLVLQAVGLPVEGIGLILAIDWLMDRFRTTVNVWGDAIGAAVISRFQKA